MFYLNYYIIINDTITCPNAYIITQVICSAEDNEDAPKTMSF